MPKKRSSLSFVNFGNDLKEARLILGLSRRVLAEMVNIDARYLANIENSGSLPSIPIFCELVRICQLSVEKYFYPELNDPISPQRQRTTIKFKLCPERYLPIVEATIDGIIRIDEAENPQ